ncbi:hypothetical protein C5167_003729 [Papaver somniferum]|uniref:Uncharacterized protein n=1 Tax=Papaver somniferum TaxID=3469 RepID=A0A4Y7L4Z2_PAPSO|nr:hypothetical protein C5167_003729 [Papaver somniferum]
MHRRSPRILKKNQNEKGTQEIKEPKQNVKTKKKIEEDPTRKRKNKNTNEERNVKQKNKVEEESAESESESDEEEQQNSDEENQEESKPEAQLKGKSRANEKRIKGGLQPLVDMGNFLRTKFEVEDANNKKKLILAKALKESPNWDLLMRILIESEELKQQLHPKKGIDYSNFLNTKFRPEKPKDCPDAIMKNKVVSKLKNAEEDESDPVHFVRLLCWFYERTKIYIDKRENFENVTLRFLRWDQNTLCKQLVSDFSKEVNKKEINMTWFCKTPILGIALATKNMAKVKICGVPEKLRTRYTGNVKETYLIIPMCLTDKDGI